MIMITISSLIISIVEMIIIFLNSHYDNDKNTCNIIVFKNNNKLYNKNT